MKKSEPFFTRIGRMFLVTTRQYVELWKYETKRNTGLMLEIDRLEEIVIRQEALLSTQARIMDNQQKAIDILFEDKIALGDSIAELKEQLRHNEG